MLDNEIQFLFFMTGTIPEQLWGLGELETVDLSDNYLEGESSFDGVKSSFC